MTQDEGVHSAVNHPANPFRKWHIPHDPISYGKIPGVLPQPQAGLGATHDYHVQLCSCFPQGITNLGEHTVWTLNGELAFDL